MDQTQRPFVIPVEFQKYAEENDLMDLFKRMMEYLIISQPDDPLAALKGFLLNLDSEAPKVVILGPPASGKRSLARALSQQLGCLHLTTEKIFNEAPAELRAEAQELVDRDQEIPEVLWAKLFNAKITTVEVRKRGYVMDDYPKTRLQALELQALGAFPRHCIFLDLSDTICMERAEGKRVDPVNGDIYHTAFIWPNEPRIVSRLLVPEKGYTVEETVSRLLHFQRHRDGIERAFSTVVRHINADQPAIDIVKESTAFINTRPRSYAPFTPRVVLIGAPGSGKRLQAALLAAKYNLVNVSAAKVYQENILNDTKHSSSVKSFMQQKLPIPDTIAMEMLEERLGKPDCMIRGWVLTGFPTTRDQAELLESSGFNPNRIFFLDLPLDAAIDRICQRAVDPVTGDTFHLLLNPPRSATTASRLIQRPTDREEIVRKAYGAHKSAVVELREYYSQSAMFRINAEADPHSVFENIEGRLVANYKKQF